MALSDKFYIKVDDFNVYKANGTAKSLKQIHTLNNIIYPCSWNEKADNGVTPIENPWPKYEHTVLKNIGTDPNAYNPIASQSTDKFVNLSEGVDLLFDKLEDGITPVVSKRLYKAGVDYPIMNPYMVEVLDYLSRNWKATLYPTGTYYLNKYGWNGMTTVKNVGIMVLQGGGGGSGGTNNTSADSAGGGGGAGGFAAIYYRIKNHDATITLDISTGAGGTPGGSNGSTNGGAGGDTIVKFSVPNRKYVFIAKGGAGGVTGNYNYTDGGTGGNVVFQTREPDDTLIGEQILATGGRKGSDNYGPLAGSTDTNGRVVFEDGYIFLAILAAQGGAGGGRGDDTDGTTQGQAGAGVPAITFNIPYALGTGRKQKSFPAQSGGARGSSVSEAAAGGGGASMLAPGGAGGKQSTNGNPGSYGSGAGGAGCGGNANRAGSAGGAGAVYYYYYD